MTFAEIAVHSSHASTLSALRLANRLAALARGTVHVPPVDLPEDDVFTPSRLKATRLPAVEACQTTIFRELRHREELHGTHAEDAHEEADPQPHSFSVRISHLFHAH